MSGENESQNPDIKPDWEKRLEELKEGVYTTPRVSQFVIKSLTDDEKAWLETRLQTVERAATKMAQNMLKGVLKYENQDRDLESWTKHWLDDGTDNFAYMWLVAESIERELGINTDE